MDDLFARAVRLLPPIALVAVSFATGLGVEPSDVLRTLRGFRPVIAGIVANFVLVPLAARVLLDLFAARPSVALGFLILAACPGAPVVPVCARLARGDVPTAVGQMVLLAFLSALLAPLVLRLSVPALPDGGTLQVDSWAIVRTLAITQFLPLAAGMACRRLRREAALRDATPAARMGNLLLLSAIGLVLVREGRSFVGIPLRAWSGMLLLAAACLAIGGICGGPGGAVRRSFAVTACARNAGVALVVAVDQFPGTVVPLAVTAYGLLSILAAFGAALLLGASSGPST